MDCEGSVAYVRCSNVVNACIRLDDARSEVSPNESVSRIFKVFFGILVLRVVVKGVHDGALLPISNQKCRRRKFESILNLFEYVKKIQILPALSKHVGAGGAAAGGQAGRTLKWVRQKGKKG